MGFVYRLKAHLLLVVIVLVYLIIATVHSLVVPLTVGNDEWAHFLYIRFIAEHGRLPTTLAERSNRAEAGYKADDPPLYHLLVAAVTAGLEPTRLLRPINSPQRQLADNILYPYAFIVHTGPEAWPYRGEVLLWRLARLISITFGGAAIILTYLTALELGRGSNQAALAAAVLAFMPAFIFHSSMVTYESLSVVFAALFLLAGIKAIKQPRLWRWWLVLGLVAGLSITTKYSAVLLPLEIVFIAWLASTRLSPGQLLPGKSSLGWWGRRLLLAGLALFLALSWWFGFVLWHFNRVETKGWVVGILEPLIVRGAADSTAVNIAASLFGEQKLSADAPLPPQARNYPQLARMVVESFWAGPINGDYFLSPGLPLLFSLIALGGLLGLWFVWRRGRAGLPTRTWLILLMFHVLLITPLLVIRLFLSTDPREVAQGRHFLMPAASALAVLLSWGWTHWGRKIGPAVAAALFLWSLIGQLGWAIITYSPPIPVWTRPASPMGVEEAQPVKQTFMGVMQLSGFSWRETPPASIEVTLWWESLSRVPADYLVELTLLDEAKRPVSYTLGHPAQGRYPTRAWEPGDVIKDTYWLPLTGSLGGTYQLQLRLLDRAGQPLPAAPTLSLAEIVLDGQPAYPPPDPCTVWFQGQPDSLLTPAYRLRSTLTLLSPDPPVLIPLPGTPGGAEQKPLASVGQIHTFVVGPEWSSRYQLRAGSTACHELNIEVPARGFTPPPIAQPLTANFNDEVLLLGYDLPTRRIQPGQRLPLTLYWQALAYMGEDYKIFDNLLDSEQRRWGGYDRQPRDGYSTLLWVPGEVITDAFGVPVEPDAPPGIYTLDLGLYRQTDSGAVSLPLLQNGQPSGQNSLRLGPIKVGGPPLGVTVTAAEPQVKLGETLGGQITLLGYDEENNCQQSIVNCQLLMRFYWQAETVPSADYTTFLHLRDAANNNVTQKDSPPAVGRYPTSLWDTGEIIADEVTLSLADVPPGRYTPVIGLYNLATGERLSTPGNPANEIALEPVERP